MMGIKKIITRGNQTNFGLPRLGRVYVDHAALGGVVTVVVTVQQQ